ncbi:nucleotidyl transferase AbiEii/AbiGii toxin family protein [Candidatus Parvarchaeota archaeon]|nr:nucleotidyl transferase AbiEii/AbiGii toxin family protein [Candidatus Parvarchaeota archaeon]
MNKVYLGEKARFSEDADFEIAGKKDIRSVIAQIDVIRANSSDFFKTERRLLKIYSQVDFFYETSNNFSDKVRLDVAFNESGEKSSYQKVNEITSQFSQERVHNLYVYKLEELLARKLYAMYNRTEGKDLYDFFYGVQIVDSSKLYNAIERFFKRKSLLIEKVLPAIVDKLRSTEEDYIAAKVNNYIPFQFRPKSWKILSNSIADFISRLTK